MGRWLRGVVVVTAAVVGMVGVAPMAQAQPGGDTPAATIPTAPTALTLFDDLPTELMNCVLGQLPGDAQLALRVTCRRLQETLAVVHTQGGLNTALENPTGVGIVVVPHENITIGTVPANPQTHIAVYATQPWQINKVVQVRANIHVTASGTAHVRAFGSSQVTASGGAHVTAYDSSQVTASGGADVWAYGSSQVTASGTAHVRAFDLSQVTASGTAHVRAFGSSQVTASGTTHVTAYDSSQVTASGTTHVTAYTSSQVIAFQEATVLAHHWSRPTATVTGHGCLVRIWTTPTSQAVIRLDDASRRKTISAQEMTDLINNGVEHAVW